MTRRWRFPMRSSRRSAATTVMLDHGLGGTAREGDQNRRHRRAIIDPDNDRKPDAMRRFESGSPRGSHTPAAVHDILVESTTLALDMIKNLDLVGGNTPPVEDIMVLADGENLPDIVPVDIDDTSSDLDGSPTSEGPPWSQISRRRSEERCRGDHRPSPHRNRRDPFPQREHRPAPETRRCDTSPDASSRSWPPAVDLAAPFSERKWQ